MNIKLLSRSDRFYLNQRYSFSVNGDYVLVKVSTCRKVTPYKKLTPIKIVTKVRVITISVKALTLWERAYIGRYSPIDIQNAINALVISSREASDEAIAEMLEIISKKDAQVAF